MEQKLQLRYELYDYTCRETNAQISALYRRVFHMDADVDADPMLKPNPFGRPQGIITRDPEGKVIGHFATMCTMVQSGSTLVPGRISFGFMVDADYRGMHIASTMSKKLFAHLREEGKTAFVIGFPNENSFHLHTHVMGYAPIRDYQMVCLPRGGGKQTDDRFFLTAHLPGEPVLPDKVYKNKVRHSAEQLNWKFAGTQYRKFATEDGACFVCNTYRQYTQIVYWSPTVTPELLLAFAAHLYDLDGAEEVRTWNSVDWLQDHPKRERLWHLCLHVLTEDPTLRMQLLEAPWLFLPGDTELF